MQINKLTIDDLMTINPNNSSFLSNHNIEDEAEYTELYNAYRKLFSEYFIELIDLKNFDIEIKNSDLHFLKYPIENQDVYQYFTNQELDYFYFRNNCYVENLSDDDKNYLKQLIESNSVVLDATAKAFIERTYQSVITEDTVENVDKVFYGPSSVNYLLERLLLLIGFSYDEYNYDGMTDDEWKELHKKQINYIVDAFNRIMVAFDNLNIPLNIKAIKYGPFSIFPRR